TPVATPPAPEWLDDDRFMSAWRSVFPSRERDDDAEARRALDLLTAPPPFTRGQGKPKRRRVRHSSGYDCFRISRSRRGRRTTANCSTRIRSIIVSSRPPRKKSQPF